MTQRTCPACARDIPNDSSYCEHCGGVIADKTNKQRPLILIAVGILVIVIVAAILIVTKGSPDLDEQAFPSHVLAEATFDNGVVVQVETLELNDGQLLVSNDIELRFVADAPGLEGLNDHAFNLLDGAVEISPSGSLEAPVTISFSWPDDLADEMPDGTPQLFVYDQASNRWEPELVLDVDLDNRELTAELGHFSEYVVLIPDLVVTQLVPSVSQWTEEAVSFAFDWALNVGRAALNDCDITLCELGGGDCVDCYIRSDNQLSCPSFELVGWYELTITLGWPAPIVVWRQAAFLEDYGPSVFSLLGFGYELSMIAEDYAPIVRLAENEQYVPLAVADLFADNTTIGVKLPWRIGVETITGSEAISGFLSTHGHHQALINGQHSSSLRCHPTRRPSNQTDEECLADMRNYGLVRLQAGNLSATDGLQSNQAWKEHLQSLPTNPTLYWDFQADYENLIITYWMLYPFDLKSDDLRGGLHTLDRESISVVFEWVDFEWGVEAAPIEVIYAAHIAGQNLYFVDSDDRVVEGWDEGALRLRWSEAIREGNHPVAYIADGSHGVYPWQGDYMVDVRPLFFPLQEDGAQLNFRQETWNPTVGVEPADANGLTLHPPYIPINLDLGDVAMPYELRPFPQTIDPDSPDRALLFAGYWVDSLGTSTNARYPPFIPRSQDTLHWWRSLTAPGSEDEQREEEETTVEGEPPVSNTHNCLGGELSPMAATIPPEFLFCSQVTDVEDNEFDDGIPWGRYVCDGYMNLDDIRAVAECRGWREFCSDPNQNLISVTGEGRTYTVTIIDPCYLIADHECLATLLEVSCDHPPCSMEN